MRYQTAYRQKTIAAKIKHVLISDNYIRNGFQYTCKFAKQATNISLEILFQVKVITQYTIYTDF